MIKLMMKSIYIPLLFVFFISCKNKITEENAPETIVSVTTTSIETGAINEFVDLNATASYLIKNIIKANTTGYVEEVNVVSNDFVNKGKIIFSLKTREAKALGTSLNKLDSSLNFGNGIQVKASTNGFISAVNVQKGDYVQDGDQLAVINDIQSFAIVMSLPYELKKYISINTQLSVFLPDGKEIVTRVEKFIPSVDIASQTQNVVLKYKGKQDIPENLIVKVRIQKTSNAKTISVPKEAVLCDETETVFWIMKMINADTAIKIPIRKGIENENRVEILYPLVTKKDQILLTGNYGVGDTIKVKIVNQ